MYPTTKAAPATHCSCAIKIPREPSQHHLYKYIFCHHNQPSTAMLLAQHRNAVGTALAGRNHAVPQTSTELRLAKPAVGPGLLLIWEEK